MNRVRLEANTHGDLISTICFKVADIVRDNQAKNSKYG